METQAFWKLIFPKISESGAFSFPLFLSLLCQWMVNALQPLKASGGDPSGVGPDFAVHVCALSLLQDSIALPRMRALLNALLFYFFHVALSN